MARKPQSQNCSLLMGKKKKNRGKNKSKIGFPGGLIDEGEDERTALRRECLEEFHFTISKNGESSSDDGLEFICSHYHPGVDLTTHLYAHKLTEDQLQQVERNVHKAYHFASEVLGVIRGRENT